MKTVIQLISEEVSAAFAACGYEERFGAVSLSNRPDLCQYQCNGAMAAAKLYHKAPLVIANEVVARLVDSTQLGRVEAVMPGFINMDVSASFLRRFLVEMEADERLGCDKLVDGKTAVIDYGGANVAKPLHVGHLRPAVIGEAVKRMKRFAGYTVIGDAHLGDWGLQMGLIITWLKDKQPELPYFDENFTGEYPTEPPFTDKELEQIYPEASKRSKTDAAFLAEAQEAVLRFQNKDRGYFALWQHIIAVSVIDIKRVYESLNVSFDLWKRESDAQPYIPDMVQYLKEEGYAHLSDGALVVDVKEETDTKEMPPCMILKSNGATLYDTTDLATIVERMKLFSPDEIIYVVDKRQDLYFERIFRCARKTKLVNEDTGLYFLGNGTMNGKDGKPFKTRDGGVMRLDSLIESVSDEVYKRISENREIGEEQARETAHIVGIAALKYGDLSNQITKDYVFDVERFTSFEGNTGPYILYTIVRIKSILARYSEQTGTSAAALPTLAGAAGTYTCGETETALRLAAARLNDVIAHAAEEMAPHKICQYLYELADTCNTFYHAHKIIAQEDKAMQEEWIALMVLVRRILELCTELIGIRVPERM